MYSRIVIFLLFAMQPMMSVAAPTRSVGPNAVDIRNHFRSDPEKWKGITGYLKISDELFGSQMAAAFKKTSVALTAAEFRTLNWEPIYDGLTNDFREEQQRLFPKGELNLIYQGMDGLHLYSGHFYKQNETQIPINLRTLYLNSFATLTPQQRRLLGWRLFNGSPNDYTNDRMFLLSRGKVSADLKTVSGYVRFSETYDGDMAEAYDNARAVLGPVRFRELEWPGRFDADVESYLKIQRALRERVRGRLKYEGIEGYLSFAETFYLEESSKPTHVHYRQGDMEKAYTNAVAALRPAEFENLGWPGLYHGTTLKYVLERTRLLSALNTDTRFRGEEGFRTYANRFYPGRRLHLAWVNVKGVLNARDFHLLGWPAVNPFAPDDPIDVGEHLFENGRLRNEYRNPEGFMKFANEFYRGSTKKAFADIVVQLSQEEMNQLGWHQSDIETTAEFRSLRQALLTKRGDINKEYLDSEGYVRFANERAGGMMTRAWSLARAVLADAHFQQLRWRLFEGTTYEREGLRIFMSQPDGQLNYEMWHRRNDGLSKLVYAYLGVGQTRRTVKPALFRKTEGNFRAALTDAELTAMGWELGPEESRDGGICRAF